MTYQRPQAAILARRLAEPRCFIHAVAGPRQVGKKTLVQQVVEAAKLPVQFARADEPTLKPQRQLLVGGDGVPVEEFLTRDVAHWVGAMSMLGESDCHRGVHARGGSSG